MARKKETGSGKETPLVKVDGQEVHLDRRPPYHNNSLQVAFDAAQATVASGLLMQSVEIANLPDINLRDAEAVRKRIAEYFTIVAKNGNKPTVAGLGLALNGMDRRRLWEIKTGNYGNTRGTTADLPAEVTDAIKKAYKVMEELWENYMQNGLINPVSGIFLGKNNYGYQDKTEYVVTPNTHPDSEVNEDDMLKRYRIPAGAGGASDSDSDSDSDLPTL